MTNAYIAGAFAFALFAIAARAVNEDRNLWQQSIRQFREEWEEVLARITEEFSGEIFGRMIEK